MPRSTLLAAAFVVFFGLACARTLHLDKRNAPRAIVAPMSLAEDKHLGTRSLTADLPFERKGYLLIRLEFGSNDQPVEVAFDTGSSITWVNPQCENIDNEDRRKYCEERGRFTPEDSHTYRDDGELTKTAFISVKDIGLAWGRDTIKISGKPLENAIFAIATETTRLTTGILGAGRLIKGEPHPLPVQMWGNDLISSPTFSLYVGSNDKGTVVFGGIDTKKFTGTLQQLAVDRKDPGAKLGLWIVPVESMTLTLDGKSLFSLDVKRPMVIDSGAPRHIFPPDIADAIAAAFAAAVTPSADAQPKKAVIKRPWKGGPSYFFMVDCAHQNRQGSLDLYFNDLLIQIPFADFIVPYVDDKCALDFRTHTYTGDRQGTIVLGHALLRHTYTVYVPKHDIVFIGKKSTCTDSLIEDIAYNEMKAVSLKFNREKQRKAKERGEA